MTPDSQYIIGDDYRDPKHGCLAVIVAVILTVLCCLFFGGCKSLPPAVVPEVHNTYNGHDRDHSSARGDSIHVRDSIVYRYLHDTLMVDRWHTEYRNRWRHDTLTVRDSVHVTDSVPYPVYVEKPVPYRSGYTRFTSWFFWITAILLLLKLSCWVMEKIPTTAPYVLIARKFVPFL